MSYTRGQWVTDFLHALGNNSPTQNVINWVTSWTSAETAPGRTADYNLLNTTYNDSNVTGIWNSVGVKSYSGYVAGISANVATIEEQYYPQLLDALRTNNEHALGFGASAPSPGIRSELNTWCGSCGYGNTFVNMAGKGSGDTFSGDVGTFQNLSSAVQSFFPSCSSNPSAWYCFPTTQAYGVPEGNVAVGGIHAGIDIGDPLGTKITAIDPGTIVAAGPQAWGGDVLEQVTTAGKTVYDQFLHLENINVKVGQQVNAGDLLGLSGGTSGASPIPTQGKYSSGPHLHFAQYTTGLPEQWGFANTIDPTSLIKSLGSGKVPTSASLSTLSDVTNTTPSTNNCWISVAGVCVNNPFAGFDWKNGAIRTGLVIGGAIIILIAVSKLLANPSPSINVQVSGDGGSSSDDNSGGYKESAGKGYSGNEEVIDV